MREAKRNVTAVDTKSLSKRHKNSVPARFYSLRLSLSLFLSFLRRKFLQIFLFPNGQKQIHNLLRFLLRAYYVVWYIKKIAHTSFVYARAIYDSITRNSSYTLGRATLI